jgi:hypothetical protein
MEGACPGRATPTTWRCGHAARQLSAPQPGTQTLPTGNHFFARRGGGAEQGAEAAAKAEAGLRPEPMAGASDARPLFAQTAVHRSMPGGCIEQTPNKICSRGTRGLSDVGSARGACAAAAALRGHARVVQARVRRGVPPQAGAHSPPEKSLLRNFLTEELGVGSNEGGGVIAQELPEQIAKLLVWKPAGSTRVTPTFYVIQARNCPLLLVLLVQCLWGAIHVNKLPRPSGHY